MNYHLARNNEQLGTFTLEEVRKGLADGTYLATDLAWTAGMAEWLPAGTLPELSAPSGPPALSTQPPARIPDPMLRPEQAVPQHVSIGVAPTPSTAIASLVLGIVSLVTCYVGIVFAIPGIICGHMALKAIKESGNRLQGRGLAIAGLIMSYLWMAFWSLMVVLMGIAAAFGSFNV